MPSVDRISSLTDGVLCHILSFLPTKISVATSILARRWRFLWAYVPNLDFDCRNHDTGTKFAHIVNRVLLLRQVQSINSFRLRYDDLDCSEYELDTWIATAILRNAKKLDLCLAYFGELPQCLFTCKTLVDLRLHFRNCIPSNGVVVSLPSLKKLHIYGVENGLRHMLSGCPVLEELIIDQIDEDDLDFYDVIISSPTITRLIMNNFKIYSYESYSRGYGVKINVQALIVREVDARLKCWMEEPQQVPKSLLSHLGTVRIYQFECAEDEFKLVRYILKNAQVLKRMEIHFKCYDVCLKTNAIQRIFLFERGSEACELAFN